MSERYIDFFFFLGGGGEKYIGKDRKIEKREGRMEREREREGGAR